MSTHKHFDRICYVVIAFTLIITVLFVNAESFGIQKASGYMKYEYALFDTSYVHSIDIKMDNWDEFIKKCKSEEYYECSVVIDNEEFKNVAIRGKGNTSLTQVDSYGNDRYSLKIEFDHYDSTNTYYGLDKLCLNNIIQDNTYMKDYLTYQMMGDMGVASPLCSYVYITVNGEDYGLYLAAEAVEDSFLQRNYGRDYGELYKPDNMKMGGGRGNGKEFDMDKFMDENSEEEDSGQEEINENASQKDSAQSSPDSQRTQRGQRPDMGNMPPNRGEMPDFENKPNGGARPDMENMPDFENKPNSGARPDMENMPDFENMPNMDDKMPDFENMPEMDESMKEKFENGGFGGKGPGGMNKSDDVLLKYIDDETDSYSSIFESAKTDITKSDKTRLIEALKKLSEGTELSDTVDIETVIKYFVVHNFVLNFDSYTGSMIHNYYLYEKNGQMQMIPWDYNLAFGGFMSMGGAESLVNYPIDSPVSGGDMSERPMISWIFENEEYTELYHTYFEEFIDTYFESGYFANMIEKVNKMISPYVEKDPTKFCTYEEFEKGISTLKEFCLLRAESIKGQLDGSIGSTSDTQEESTLISADGIEINDMGSMHK